VLLWAAPVAAHPAPFSYLDLHLTAAGVTGTLVVHDLDAAHDLGVPAADSLMDTAVAARYRDRLVALLATRVALTFDGRPAAISWQGLDVVADRQSLRLAFTVTGDRPGRVGLHAYVFPYDPVHQTFVNIYEDGALAHQAILDERRRALDYYTGTTQGRWAVVRTFAASGIEHILIGPDHILFLVGLLLLGGTFGRLALIVTAFTVGHSITLSLAALEILSPPARYIEPLIALTIVVVGADNLLVIRGRTAGNPEGLPPPDIRAWLAAAFGLIHGFGFASVLKEFGLPREALGWSLFSFNLGVEAGQLVIVVVVAGALAWLGRAHAAWSSRVAWGGSIGVILAGLYWFVERVFLTGGA
jgi:hypothetical protein